MSERAAQFLRDKGMLRPGYKRFWINGSFGKVDLAELLHEYHTTVVDEQNGDKIMADTMVGMFDDEEFELGLEDDSFDGGSDREGK